MRMLNSPYSVLSCTLSERRSSQDTPYILKIQVIKKRIIMNIIDYIYSSFYYFWMQSFTHIARFLFFLLIPVALTIVLYLLNKKLILLSLIPTILFGVIDGIRTYQFTDSFYLRFLLLILAHIIIYAVLPTFLILFIARKDYKKCKLFKRKGNN